MSGDVLLERYVPGFGCLDADPLQAALNRLYDYSNDPETKVLHRSRLNLFHSVMTRLVSQEIVRDFRQALDLGCNAGYYSKMLSDFGFEDVLGVDIEPQFVARAQEHFGSDAPGRRRSFRVADAEQLVEREVFSFVLCTEVIEHTSHPDRVIANLASALVPGGIAVVTLPNRTSIPYGWARIVHFLKQKPYDPVLRDHLSWPSTRSVRILHPHGLELLGTTGANLVLTGGLIRALHGRPGFPTIHRLNDAASRSGLLHRWSQFFLAIWRKPLGSAEFMEPATNH